MNAHPLVGTWRLLYTTFEDADGNITYPSEQDVLGYLTYTADGYMHWALIRAHHPRVAEGDRTEPGPAVAVELQSSYNGTYALQPDKVIHNVELCKISSQVGAAHERFYAITDERLELITEPMVAGDRIQTGHLVFERV